MKVDSANIDKQALYQLLKAEYGLEVATLSFVPAGEESYGYIAGTVGRLSCGLNFSGITATFYDCGALPTTAPGSCLRRRTRRRQARPGKNSITICRSITRRFRLRLIRLARLLSGC